MTLPWSMVGVLVTDAIAPGAFDTTAAGLLIAAVGAASNCALLFWIGTRFRCP